MKKFFLLATLCLALTSGRVSAEPYNPIVYQTLAIGTRSGCDVAAKMVVTSEAQWKRIWNKHIAGDEIKMSAPPVDWSHKAVIVLLGGNSRGASLEVQHITRDAGITTVYYSAARDGSGMTQPFHFALIDAPNGPVRFADGNIDCSVCAQLHAK